MKKVREGYKMTEFGEIPSEWNINLVKDITTEHKQGYYAKNDYNDNGTYLMRITDLRNQKINFKEMPRIEIDDDIYEQYKVELGDFLFARSGAIGRYGIYDTEDYPQAVFASYIIRFRFNTSNVNNKYFGYFYESNYCLNQLKAITQGSSNININANNIKDLKICLPPLKEQEKIALILSTVDEQIDNVDELIQKNKELKKGLMQQLLTKGIGHTKFKKTEIGAIPEEWEVVKLSNCANIIDSLHETPEYSESGFSMIRVIDVNGKAIDTKSTNKVCEEVYKKFTRKYEPQKGDIIMSRVGSYGLVSYLKDSEKVCLGQNIVVITTELYKRYLFYVLSSEYIKRNIEKVTVGSSQKTLSLANINALKVPVPRIQEQKEIALILSEVDKRIEEYENKKEKLEELKRGLMQQLLTGKIRV
ncbi:restriction endonuclease subunit S [Clostridium nigeriense]|uniref:restriction endonuclease subunit S n=1 Tax=Clostridium nigeriense TaxID=1805470 RepID=UPI003D34CE08